MLGVALRIIGHAGVRGLGLAIGVLGFVWLQVCD